MEWIFLAIVILLGLLVLPVLVDALSLLGSVRIEPIEVDTRIGEKHDTLFVHFPGELFSGISGCEPFQATLSRYGDTARIAYHGDRFKPDVFAWEACKKIGPHLTEYNHVVLLGSSMGGKLALDFMKLIDHPTVSLVMIDTPVDSSHLLSGRRILAPLMKFLPFGRASNVAYRPFTRKILDDWSLSLWRDQVYYLDRRKVVQADLRHFEHVLYVRCSSRNEFVAQPDAAFALADVAGRPVGLLSMQTPHCEYALSPVETNKTFEEIVERVL